MTLMHALHWMLLLCAHIKVNQILFYLYINLCVMNIYFLEMPIYVFCLLSCSAYI
jgi:hypothetical protein